MDEQDKNEGPKNLQQSTQVSQSESEGRAPSAQSASAPPMAPPAPSSREDATAKSKLLWPLLLVILGAVLGTFGQGALQELHNWYYRPRLEMWYSMSTLAPGSYQQSDSANNYALFFDDLKNCSIALYRIKSDPSFHQAWSSKSETFWKFYLHNSGRSPVTEISFVFDEGDETQVEVETTPNLAVDVRKVETATGVGEQVISIRELQPGAFGMITIKDKNDGAKIHFEEASGLVSWQVSGRVSHKVAFQGSKELGGKVEFHPDSANELLYLESMLYGESALRAPFVEGADQFMNPGKLHAPELLIPNQKGACPFTTGSPTNFLYHYTVHVSPSQASPESTDQSIH